MRVQEDGMRRSSYLWGLRACGALQNEAGYGKGSDSLGGVLLEHEQRKEMTDRWVRRVSGRGSGDGLSVKRRGRREWR